MDNLSDHMDVVYTSLGILILFFAIWVILVRWVFRVNTIIKNQETQIQLLAKIAVTQGASTEEVKAIVLGTLYKPTAEQK